jgi:hypothetical protein
VFGSVILKLWCVYLCVWYVLNSDLLGYDTMWWVSLGVSKAPSQSATSVTTHQTMQRRIWILSNNVLRTCNLAVSMLDAQEHRTISFFGQLPKLCQPTCCRTVSKAFFLSNITGSNVESNGWRFRLVFGTSRAQIFVSRSNNLNENFAVFLRYLQQNSGTIP